MAAADQLERILYIIPCAARADGASIAELARALDVDEATILRDLTEATERVYHHPAGTVDPFEIVLDGERVHVFAPHDFQRPARLNAREGLALELGLRVLAADLPASERTHIIEFAERLADQLSAPELTLQPALARGAPAPAPEAEPAIDIDVEEDIVRGVLADAITEQRLASVLYLKPGSAPAERKVAPRRLIHDHGRWYLAARDMHDGADKLFRLDRMLRAEIVEERAPADLGDAPIGFSFQGDGGELEARVRYSRRIAPWILEQSGAEPEPDGSVLLTHKVADPQWLVRHVLQYGGEAVVETPAWRPVVAEAAARIVSACD